MGGGGGECADTCPRGLWVWGFGMGASWSASTLSSRPSLPSATVIAGPSDANRTIPKSPFFAGTARRARERGCSGGHMPHSRSGRACSTSAPRCVKSSSRTRVRVAARGSSQRRAQALANACSARFLSARRYDSSALFVRAVVMMPTIWERATVCERRHRGDRERGG